jgi:hypothetical protein
VDFAFFVVSHFRLAWRAFIPWEFEFVSDFVAVRQDFRFSIGRRDIDRVSGA